MLGLVLASRLRTLSRILVVYLVFYNLLLSKVMVARLGFWYSCYHKVDPVKCCMYCKQQDYHTYNSLFSVTISLEKTMNKTVRFR